MANKEGLVIGEE